MTNQDPELAEVTDKAILKDAMIRKYSWWAFGAGAIPLPLFDMVAITGIQLKMLNDMAALYEVPFSDHKGKSLLATLLGGVVPTSLTLSSVGSLFKSIPVVGTIVGSLTLPTLAGASTYAVGRVFAQHFASGGTLLDFDPDKVKAHFKEEFEQGKKVLSNSSKKAETAKPATA